MIDADKWWDGMSRKQRNEMWVTHYEQQKSLDAAPCSASKDYQRGYRAGRKKAIKDAQFCAYWRGYNEALLLLIKIPAQMEKNARVIRKADALLARMRIQMFDPVI